MDDGAFSQELTIRRFVPTDHDAVWNLHNVALYRIGVHAGNGPWDDDPHNIEALYIDRGGVFVVGIEDGRILATGGGSCD